MNSVSSAKSLEHGYLNSMEKTREDRIEAYVKSERKSPFGAFVLAFLFGPIGYLYASVLGGIIWAFVAFVFFAAAPASVVVIWLMCAVTAPVSASNYNQKLRHKAELMAGG